MEPDEDYENPVGEVLDDETLQELHRPRLGIVEGAPWVGWKN